MAKGGSQLDGQSGIRKPNKTFLQEQLCCVWYCSIQVNGMQYQTQIHGLALPMEWHRFWKKVSMFF